MSITRILAIFIMVLGLVAIVIGGVFVGEGVAKNNLITERMNLEKVTIALDPNHPDVLTQVNNATEAQQAADKIAADRRSIAPTYQDLLNQSGGRFDPTNAKDLSYAQAMNLENYLYLAVAAFGLIQVTLASGAFMVITGLALGGAGFAIFRLGRG
jgi:hypothetical protein